MRCSATESFSKVVWQGPQATFYQRCSYNRCTSSPGVHTSCDHAQGSHSNTYTSGCIHKSEPCSSSFSLIWQFYQLVESIPLSETFLSLFEVLLAMLRLTLFLSVFALCIIFPLFLHTSHVSTGLWQCFSNRLHTTPPLFVNGQVSNCDN